MLRFSSRASWRCVVSLFLIWSLLVQIVFFFTTTPFTFISAKQISQSQFPDFTQEEVATYAAQIEQVTGSFDDLSNAFQKVAHERGGVFAFEVMKIVKLRPGVDFHLLGHEVGDILYEQEGTEGMKFCTPDFRNACSHTIVVGAFLEFGEGAIPLVTDACSRAPGGKGAYGMCFHGLGHGVLAYVGYDIDKTVKICQKMGTAEHDFVEYTECVGGAIMEIISGGGHDRTIWEEMRPKYLRYQQPLEPCSLPIIPDIAKPMCYTYLSPHLFMSAGADLAAPQPIHFEKSFSYCEEIPTEQVQNRDACFGGIGKEFIALAKERDIRNLESLTDVELQKIITWCDLARPEDGKRYCLRSAMRSLYWGGENDVVLPIRFCALQTGEKTKRDCLLDLQRLVKFYATSRESQTTFCHEMAQRAGVQCQDL